MDANSLRRAFLGYFESHGHQVVPSSGLIPHHPRAPLFTNAGMNQFIPYFLGEEQPPYPRATSVQKCVRIRGKHDDIDLIGRTTRHLTFFEMLGNFSFGDYFKDRAIPLAWGLLTEVFGLDPTRMWASVYKDDDEAADIWSEVVGLPPERIVRMDEDNFWEMGDSGPCGPCSEIYFDRGEAYGPPGGPLGGGEERFVEIWNLVFMQYDRQPGVGLVPLPKPNIDTGAGLERLAMVLQGVPSIWETDLLRPLIARAEALTGVSYGEGREQDVALRILADHSRAVSFLVSDGVFPSNEDRGYVLRRLIRRAVLQAHALGAPGPVMGELVLACAENMGEAYPELARSAQVVAEVVSREEQRFERTLRSGLEMLESELAGGSGVLSGEVAFKLHDTHGFPVELTREIAAKSGASLDEEGFAAAMARQKALSAQARRSSDLTGTARLERYRALVEAYGPTRFVGYEQETTTAEVIEVAPAEAEGLLEVFLDQTPFYAEGGGQVGDTGLIQTETGTFVVQDTNSALPGLTRHLGRLAEGDISPGQLASAAIDAPRREAIRRNHTGTHLLHWALRQVLGEHVKQQGSLVAPDRLRFDFTHYGPLTPEQVAAVEDLVNAQVLEDPDVMVEEMDRQAADQAGAIAFFEEKYGERVRVVRAGKSSIELCGGTHVARLGQIGPLEIVSESSIGSNLRRVEATTGTATLERSRQARRTLAEAARMLGSPVEELTSAIGRRLGELRDLEAKLRAQKAADLAGQVDSLVAQAQGPWLVARVDQVPADSLRDLATQVRRKGGLQAVVLGGSPDGSRAALAAAVAKGHRPSAPELIAEPARIVGGGGGGKNPEQASAGGRDASKLDEALGAVRRALGG